MSPADSPRLIIEVEDTAGLWPRVKEDIAALAPFRDFVLTNKFGNAIDVGDLNVRFILATDPRIARLRSAAAAAASAGGGAGGATATTTTTSTSTAAPPPPGRGGPATWFRSPLATLVLVGGDDADDYKRLGVVRAAVRAVADRVAAGGGGLGAPSEWALLYVPPPAPSLPGGAGADAAAKAAARMFAALRSDWSSRRHDRCVRADVGGWGPALGALLAGAARASLEARRAAYEAEAACAAAGAASAGPSTSTSSRFAPLFLAKDSLAALLEAAGAADEALRERGELEALYLTHGAAGGGAGSAGSATPPPPLPPGSDTASLISASWRATRRAALAPGGPPDLFFRQALFAGQARLWLARGRPGEAAGAGARFVASLAAALAARRAAGRVPPLFPEAWSFSACVALVNAVGTALASRTAPGLVVEVGGSGGGTLLGGSPRPSEEPGGGEDGSPPPAAALPPAYGPSTGWGLALASWLDDPAARAAAAGARPDPATRALLARAGDLAAAARDAFARLALGCVPGAAGAGVAVRDDRLAGLAPAPLAAATPSPAKRRGGGGGGSGGGGGAGGHLVAAAAPGQGSPAAVAPASSDTSTSAPGTPRSRSRLGLEPGAVAVHTLPLTPAGKGGGGGGGGEPAPAPAPTADPAPAAAPAPDALASTNNGSSTTGSGRRLLLRAPELLRVRAATASAAGGGPGYAGEPGPAGPAPPPPALDPAAAEAAAESDAESSGGESVPGTPMRGHANPPPVTPPPHAHAHAPPVTPPPHAHAHAHAHAPAAAASKPAWVSDPRLLAGLASPAAAASLWLALTGAAVTAYVAAGRPRRAATLAAGAAPALRARGEHGRAAAVLAAHAAVVGADGWGPLAAALLPAAAADARAAGGAGVAPGDALALLALPGATAPARAAAQQDLEAAAAVSRAAVARVGADPPPQPPPPPPPPPRRPSTSSSSRHPPPPPTTPAGPTLTLAPSPGAFSRLAVGARAPPPGSGGGAGGGGERLRPAPGQPGSAPAGSVGEAVAVSAALVSHLPAPLKLASLTLTLAVLQEVALERGGRFVTEWRETETVEAVVLVAGPAAPAATLEAAGPPALVGGVGQWVGVRVGGGGGTGGAAALHLAPAAVAEEEAPGGESDGAAPVALALAPGAPVAVDGQAAPGGALTPGFAPPWQQVQGGVVLAPVAIVWVWATPSLPTPPRLTVPLEAPPRKGGGGAAGGGRTRPVSPAAAAAAAAAAATVHAPPSPPPSPRRAAAAATAAALKAAVAPAWDPASAAPPDTALVVPRGTAALDAVLLQGGGGGSAASATPSPAPRTHAARLAFAVCPPLDVGLRARRLGGSGGAGDAAVVEVAVSAPAACPWPVTVTGVRVVLPGGGGGGGGGAAAPPPAAASRPATAAATATPSLTLTGPLAPDPPLTLLPGGLAHFLAPATTAGGKGEGGSSDGGCGRVEVDWAAAAAGAPASGTAPPPPPAHSQLPSGTLALAFDLVSPPRRPGEEEEEEGRDEGEGSEGMDSDDTDSDGGGPTIRLLGPFTGRVGVPLTLCWRLERGGKGGGGGGSGAAVAGAPPAMVAFEVASAGPGWAPPSRLAGWALLGSAPGSATTVESTWTPAVAGAVRAPGLSVLSGGVGRDGGAGGGVVQVTM